MCENTKNSNLSSLPSTKYKEKMTTLAIVNKNIFAKIVVVILLATITLTIRVVIPKLMNRFGE